MYLAFTLANYPLALLFHSQKFWSILVTTYYLVGSRQVCKPQAQTRVIVYSIGSNCCLEFGGESFLVGIHLDFVGESFTLLGIRKALLIAI